MSLLDQDSSNSVNASELASQIQTLLHSMATNAMGQVMSQSV
jgi:hypothetical protein